MTMMTFLKRRRAVVVFAAAAVVLSGCNFTPYSLPLPGGADLGNHPYTVKAEFRDAMSTKANQLRIGVFVVMRVISRP